ncbi:MAG: stage V sporulation protein D, partial [Pygmaiobacter sp.]
MATEQKPKPNTTVSIRRRMIITVAVMILGGFGLLTYNLGCLQLRDYEEYQAKASEQQLRSTVIPANRGIIYDANMKVLAQSTTVWNISVSPKEIPEKDIDAIADGLADLLEVDADALRTRIRSSNSYYENVKKKVEKPVVDAVREWMSSNAYTGINIDQDTKRVYPYGAFAGTLLGFTSSDNRGIGGLEYQYNDELSGVPGRSVQATNALGYEMPYAEDSYYNAQDGNSLSLTVDEVIQHSLEKNLKLAVKTHNVTQRAVGIVMDVNTGAILGMATEGSYDPNDPYTIYDETLRAQVDTVTDNPDTAEKDEHY